MKFKKLIFRHGTDGRPLAEPRVVTAADVRGSHFYLESSSLRGRTRGDAPCLCICRAYKDLRTDPYNEDGRPPTVWTIIAYPHVTFFDRALEVVGLEMPNMCYAGVPVRANRSAHGIAAACTLRSWLGMWSLRHAQTRAEPHLARVTCPALVINAEQDTGVYPSDAQRIFDALGSQDKARCSIDTDHYFTTPGARSEKADTIAKWIAKRWR